VLLQACGDQPFHAKIISVASNYLEVIIQIPYLCIGKRLIERERKRSLLYFL
jgi:hypothetical protein